MSKYKTVDLHKAKWISTGGACSTPRFRQVIVLPKISEAQITIAGLGIYEVYINGRRVSDDLFLPLSTDYNKRTGITYGKKPFLEEFAHRLYCPVYNIRDYLTEGENTVCFMMGPGWYEHPGGSYGHIKLCYLIEYIDMSGKNGFIGSDESIQWKQSFVKEASLITGESHDYTDYEDVWMESDFDASDWQTVEIEETPETNFYIQDCPADKIIRHVAP
ncbi:MAG: alpha-L-rhamnosidase N-terminal domain-containing protein, partial [Lachnospiraceae bacterium]|nr:alpha-L-rhamnosidase N-terminal domain-containing protein [Lachnospiraceae bacterium]